MSQAPPLTILVETTNCRRRRLAKCPACCSTEPCLVTTQQADGRDNRKGGLSITVSFERLEAHRGVGEDAARHVHPDARSFCPSQTAIGAKGQEKRLIIHTTTLRGALSLSHGVITLFLTLPTKVVHEAVAGSCVCDKHGPARRPCFPAKQTLWAVSRMARRGRYAGRCEGDGFAACTPTHFLLDGNAPLTKG